MVFFCYDFKSATLTESSRTQKYTSLYETAALEKEILLFDEISLHVKLLYLKYKLFQIVT